MFLFHRDVSVVNGMYKARRRLLKFSKFCKPPSRCARNPRQKNISGTFSTYKHIKIR